MIPQNRHISARWQVRFILSVALAALLLYTGFESLPITIALIVGYLVTVMAFDYWLREAIDEG